MSAVSSKPSEAPHLPEDSSLELPTEVVLQLGRELRVGSGRLRLRYMPVHKAIQVTLLVDGDEKSSGSVLLDEQLHGLLARWIADPNRAPPSSWCSSDPSTETH